MIDLNRNRYHYYLQIGKRYYGFYSKVERNLFVSRHAKDLGAKICTWADVRRNCGDYVRIVNEETAQKYGIDTVFFGTDFIVMKGGKEYGI